MVASSSAVNGPRFTLGFSWLHQRNRHDLLDLPGKASAIAVQLPGPPSRSICLRNKSSSCVVEVKTKRVANKSSVSQSSLSLALLKNKTNKQTNKSHNPSHSQGPNRQRNDKRARVVGVQRPGRGRRRRRRPSPPTPTFETARRDGETMMRILFSRVPVSIRASPFVYPSSSSRMSRATSPRARVPVPLGSLRQRCVVSPSRPAVVRARARRRLRARKQ